MPWLPKEKVVVPIDYSDESFQALDTALDLVEGPGHVHVIHVLPDLSLEEFGVAWEAIEDQTRIGEAEKALGKRLADSKYEGLNVKIAVGSPAEEIAAFCQELGADLIVMPSHGRTGLKHLLLGSVAERVTRLAHCPVLVLRT